MIYIEIDENRELKSVVSEFAGEQGDFIVVDCLPVDDCHKLKTDHQNFTGAEKYELDSEKEELKKKQSFRKKFLKDISDNYFEIQDLHTALLLDEITQKYFDEMKITIKDKITNCKSEYKKKIEEVN